MGEIAVKAIIWDFDGTLVDTETPQFLAWQQVFGEFGARLEPEVWGKMVGTVTDWDLFDVLEEALGQAIDRRTLMRQVERLIAANMEEALLRPGVLALVEQSDGLGIRQAVASSSPRWWIRKFLSHHGLQGYFSVIAAADDVRRVKPDPEVYLTALSRLSIRASEAVAIEDSPHGARAALAAGIQCVVIPNPSTQDLQFPTGVLRLESLEGVGVSGLRAFLKNRTI